jgi:CHASE3 domain sensor protein
MKTFLANLSIRDKLFAAFAVTILFAALSISINLFTIVRMRSLNVDLQKTYADARKYYRLQAMLENLDLVTQKYLFDEDDQVKDEIFNQSPQLKNYSAQLLAEAKTPEEKSALKTFSQDIPGYMDLVNQMVSAINSGDDDGVENFIDSIDEKSEEMYDQIDNINNITSDRLNQIDSQQKLFGWLTRVMMVVSILSFVLVCILTIVTINQQINAPVNLLRKAVKSAQSGTYDPGILEKQTQRQDEIGRLTQAFVQTMSVVNEREASQKQEIEDIRSQIIK